MFRCSQERSASPRKVALYAICQSFIKVSLWSSRLHLYCKPTLQTIFTTQVLTAAPVNWLSIVGSLPSFRFSSFPVNYYVVTAICASLVPKTNCSSTAKRRHLPTHVFQLCPRTRRGGALVATSIVSHTV